MIETKRLLLRIYVPDDWAKVHLYASIPEFSQFDVWGPNSVEDTKSFIATCLEETAKTPIRRYELAIILKEEDQLIGGCSLKRGDCSETVASLGYAVSPEYQNKGYATEAAAALTEYAFTTLGVSIVFAECDTRNVASFTVMEKAGMTRADTKLNDREVKGVMTDSYRYEITRTHGAN